eukprot:10034847-Alexandrium_andersonii.AAC.1
MEGARSSWQAEFAGIRDELKAQLNQIESAENRFQRFESGLAQLAITAQGLAQQSETPGRESAFAGAPAPAGVPSPSFAGNRNDCGSWRNSRRGRGAPVGAPSGRARGPGLPMRAWAHGASRRRALGPS